MGNAPTIAVAENPNSTTMSPATPNIKNNTEPASEINDNNAVTQAMIATDTNLLNIIWKLVTGSVKSVSNVPRSFSPAVVSMAG